MTEAQKRAQQKYYQNHKENRKQFTITLPIEEYNQAQEIIKGAGTTPTELFRKALKRIENGEEL